VPWSVHPEPSDESERRALLAALDQALADEQNGARSHASAWWRAGLDDLGLGGLDETQLCRRGTLLAPMLRPQSRR
jgi:hypothetical protein